MLTCDITMSLDGFVTGPHPGEETTFTFVSDGIEAALEQARAAAAGKDVAVGGGAEVIQQYLRAGLLDELQVHVAPILLGGAPGCSTGSARPTSRSPGRSSPRPSPTSATGWSASGSGGLD